MPPAVKQRSLSTGSLREVKGQSRLQEFSVGDTTAGRWLESRLAGWTFQQGFPKDKTNLENKPKFSAAKIQDPFRASIAKY